MADNNKKYNCNFCNYSTNYPCDIKKRLRNYATGKDKHPDIQFIMIVDDAKQIENCAKLFTKENRFRGSSEIYKINFDKLKSVVFG